MTTTTTAAQGFVHTSVDDAITSIKYHTDHSDPAEFIEICEEAVRLERAGQNRASLITHLERAARKLRARLDAPPAPIEVVTASEALAQDWAAAQVTLNRTLDHGRLYIAGQAILGWQLFSIKEALGFSQRGRGRPNIRQRADFPAGTWDDHVKAHLRRPGDAISARTADRFIAVYLAARKRLLAIGETKALAILDAGPGELSKTQHQQIHGILAEITDSASQRELLGELGLVAGSVVITPDPSGHNRGGDGEELLPEQLAFHFFDLPARQILELRDHKDLEWNLNHLPLVHSDPCHTSLTELERELRALHAKVREVLEARTKSASHTL